MNDKTHTHTIHIHADKEACFSAIENIDNWNIFMPAVINAKCIESSNDYEIVEITATMNESSRTWRSKRTLNRSNGIIRFEQINPTTPIIHMSGDWQFEKSNNTTIVTLTHKAITIDKISQEYVSKSIKHNATSDLNGMKDYLENETKES